MGELEDWAHVWAKSGFDRYESSEEWLPLWQHLDDSGGVAELLVRHWISPMAVERIAREVPGGSEGVVRLAGWLARVHDVGKASPAFVVQVPVLADLLHRAGVEVKLSIANDKDRPLVNHALVGHVAVVEWLQARGFSGRLAKQWASIVGSHHGTAPDTIGLQRVRERPDLAGTGRWADMRAALLVRAARHFPDLDDFRDARLSLPSQVVLCGVVILADWIASNSAYFPLWPTPATAGQPDDGETARRVEHAWRKLALPAGWRAKPTGDSPDTLMRARFQRPSARPVQRAAAELARTDEPGIMVIEDAMGSGKTEAALLAVEELAARVGADGCVVALPTQATSDAMFSRVHAWLDLVPKGAAVSFALTHGKAHLNDEYSGLVGRGRVGAVDDCGGAIAHEWLSGRKKSALASFVVGTVDQVLFAGLRTRHLMLRHLSLAGKVVVVDEVHAYDVYMSRYLDRVLHWLGAYGVPVVLLSATLPDARRAELLRAYADGKGVAVTPPQGNPGYPVITTLSGAHAIDSTAEPKTVALDHLPDDLDTLIRHLDDTMAGRGCAVVIRNTVTRVQETAERLIKEYGADNVTVAHARFLACHRSANDRDLVRRFGQGGDRPDFHIVVASQVVEQSLDIDFDLMVTDLAPVDLVLQRLGRLHRHARQRPGPLADPRCAIVGVADWDAAPVVANPNARRIYGDHTLLRSAALVAGRRHVQLPQDIAPLVQKAYGQDPVGPASWQTAMSTAAEAAAVSARKRFDAAGSYLVKPAGALPSLTGWNDDSAGGAKEEAKGLAQVRDGEESLEVLVLQRDEAGGLLLPEWDEGAWEEVGRQVPTHDQVPEDQAKAALACSLRLPLALCHPGVVDAVIAELERRTIESFEVTPLLRGQLVLVLDADMTAELHGFRLTYDTRRGLTHDKL
ncbi:CRISPR-associated helicase Cas3' [Actinokineospora pegani]|uniref:CRISPR-associated helicase Cas3' n=1 Tax=Actinokineospora pegani TaxID=2654637 RepID=UPI0012E9C2E1|nr:CRISPR-associated helicase Cas3' [Actinokineospora pegani]